jgi:hypothetical protein
MIDSPGTPARLRRNESAREFGSSSAARTVDAGDRIVDTARIRSSGLRVLRRLDCSAVCLRCLTELNDAIGDHRQGIPHHRGLTRCLAGAGHRARSARVFSRQTKTFARTFARLT